jgi:hypothetical protein
MTGQLGLTLGLAPKRADSWSFQDAIHSVTSSEWYTPPDIIEASREALGGRIDLDPATSERANKVVQAARIFTAAAPDLSDPWVPWTGNVFSNPPNPPRPWWDAMVASWHAANMQGARGPFAGVFLAYSIEILQQTQGWSFPAMRFPFCVPKSRVRYWRTAADALAGLRKMLEKRLERSGEGATRAELKRLEQLGAMPSDELVQGDAPTHASAIVGVGIPFDRFHRAFRDIGAVVNGGAL